MNIIVCAKQIPDPDIPPAKFRIDPAAKRAIPPEGIPPVVNPDDQRAVELALRVKEKHGGTVTVLSLGSADSGSAVKHALSMGADEGVLVSDPAFEGSDSHGIAYALSLAIRKLGAYDLVVCGRQAADWDEGLVGPLLAERLGIALVTLAVGVEPAGRELTIRRLTLDGSQVLAVPTPALVTVGQEVGRPRLPSGRGIILAARKSLPVWDAAAIGADPELLGASAARRVKVRLYVPERERKCAIIEAETPAEAGARLADRLREAAGL